MTTPICFPATADEVVSIAEHAAWHRITISEWVAMIVRRALETERVQRAGGAEEWPESQGIKRAAQELCTRLSEVLVHIPNDKPWSELRGGQSVFDAYHKLIWMLLPFPGNEEEETERVERSDGAEVPLSRAEKAGVRR